MKSKALLLAGVFAFAAVPALADSIALTASVDGSVVNTSTSPDGTLDINNQSFGPIFNLNSLTINSQEFLTAPDILKTNTLDVAQDASGSHQLVIDIRAFGLAGPGALTALLNEFSVTGLTAGWSAQEQTFINGVLQADTGLFTTPSGSADLFSSAFLGNTFTAEVVYTINSNGTGSFNGGIDIATAAVPEPATWGMMLLGFLGLGAAFRRKLAAPLAA
jgi:hypothetical protein